MQSDAYMTVAEAAKALKLTRAGVYWRVDNGTLPAEIFMGRKLIPRAAVEQEVHPRPRAKKDIGMLLGAILGV